MRLTGTEGQGQLARGMGQLCFPASLSSSWGQLFPGGLSLEAGRPSLAPLPFFLFSLPNLNVQKSA